MRHYRPPAINQYRDPDDPFEPAKAFIPKSLWYILKAKSDELALPVSRLIAYALDNELDAEVPFNYPCPLPESPYVEFAFTEEAGKILKFLERFPKGTGRDMLMLCRRDIGIPNRQTFMLAYRELLESGSIEEFRPQRTKFTYDASYRYVRIVNVDPAVLKKRRYKKIEGESTKYQRSLREKDFDNDED